MDLSFFHHFTKAITSNATLKEFQWKTTFYRFFDGAWHHGISGAKPDTQLVKVLTKTRDEKIPKQAKNHHYFHIACVDAVVEVIVPPRTWQTTIDKYVTDLEECVRNAEYQFNANYDKLTRLLNRTGFEEEIRKSLKKRLDGSAVEQTEALSPSSYIALITFDIDHFKQINDSYSHQYGDAVLRAFSWRLAEHTKVLKEHQKVDFTLARLGGEEFDLLVINLKNKDEAREIAESFRVAIERDLLPTSVQWDSISRDLKLGDMALPSEQERKVTASVGYKVSSLLQNEEPLKKYSELKGQADVALYRAKADGRNCVTNYDEIRIKHGRVLQSASELNHVAIDIGADVGVKRGDVYAVRIPQFTGDVPLVQDDGRSKKKLGMFPPLTNGRITVVNVQRGIAFCQIIEKSIATVFPVGSKLEYIPMGIGRPVVSSCTFPLSGCVLQPEKFMKELARAIDSKDLAIVCVFSAKEMRSNDLANSRFSILGLADLIRASFPPTTALGIIRENQIAAFVRAEFGKTSDLSATIEKIVGSSNENVSITCGYVSNESHESDHSDFHWQNLREDDLLYAAKVANYVAVSQHRRKDSNARHEKFSASTASYALFYLRLKKRYEDAIVDYHRLAQIGVDAPLLHNQFAICVIDSRDLPRMPAAERALERAVNAAEEDVVTVSWNLGVAKAFLGHFADAYSLFMKGKNILDEKLHWLYYLACAKCACEMYLKGVNTSETDKEFLEKCIKKALTAPKPEVALEHQWIEDIKQFAKRTTIGSSL